MVHVWCSFHGVQRECRGREVPAPLLLEVRRAPLGTRSVCRVSFKSFVFGSRPVESVPNSAGCPLIQRSTRVKGQRFLFTPAEKRLLSRRARAAEKMGCDFTAVEGGHPAHGPEPSCDGRTPVRAHGWRLPCGPTLHSRLTYTR